MKNNPIQIDGLGEVTLIQSMGSDLTVVDAARVSFKKESRWECQAHDGKAAEDNGGQCYNCYLSERDAGLIAFLAKHGHWTPFAHVTATLRIKCPLFVARQLMRSNVGIVYNETSRRYVQDEPEFAELLYRQKPEKAKQGSGEAVSKSTQSLISSYVENELEAMCVKAYKHLLAQGIAPEQARAVLPQSMLTEFWMTGSLAAFARVCLLRTGKHAQVESQHFGKAMDQALRKIAPVSWMALMEHLKVGD